MADLRRSLVIIFFSHSGATLLKFLVSVALARILTPREIGIYSVTYVFVSVAQMFRDFGVGGYIMREKDLTHDKIQSAFGVAICTSWFIALLLFLSSGWIGAWFKEPEMVPVMRVLALGFVFIPFGSIANSLLTRNLEAGKQAIVTAVSTVAFCVSCLALGMLGYGSMSLAWANLINILATVLACVPFREKGLPWLPSFKHWRSVVHFGAGNLISSCATAINNGIPDVLLGKLGNAHQVGLFSRANSTISIFTHVAGTTVSYGATSYLSQAYHRGESLVPIMTRATALLTSVGWPALGLTAVLGHDITMALYGPTWLESVPAILPLSLAAGVVMLFHYTPMALTAIGRPYLGAVPVVAMLLARIAIGYAIYDGSLSSFGWAIVIATLVAMPISALQHEKHLRYPTSAMLRAVWPSAVVCLCTIAPAIALEYLLPAEMAPLLRLAAMGLPIAFCWYAGLRLTSHEMLGEVHKMGSAVQGKLGWSR